MAEDTQRNHQEICLLYENAAANLESLKKSQWQVYVFYSALAAALISQADIIREPYMKICVSILLLIGMVVAEFYEAHFRLNMMKYRGILKNIYDRFGYPFNEIIQTSKGPKIVRLDNFEIVFKYAGCAFVLAVFYLAVNTLWPAEYKWTYCSTVWPLVWVSIALIIITILLPYTMDKLVDYLARRTKKIGAESSIK